MKLLNREPFTVKDFINNFKTEENVNLLKKTLKLYKEHDAKYLNNYIIEKLEYLIYNKKPSNKYFAQFTEQQIIDLCDNEPAIEYFKYIFDVFEIEMAFNKKYNYPCPPDDVIEFWHNTYKYFRELSSKENSNKYWQKREIYQDYVNEDIIITDSCYLFEDNEELSNELEPPCDLSADTIYGDWSCSCYNKDTKEKIGDFCADAGNVCIAKLKDVIKFNPNFEKWMNKHNWCVTLIKNFTGTAYIKYDIEHYEYKGEQHRDLFCYVEGVGNINFTSRQTGF